MLVDPAREKPTRFSDLSDQSVDTDQDTDQESSPVVCLPMLSAEHVSMLVAQKSLAAAQFWRLRTYGSVDSTNRMLKEHLRAGDGEGLCISALEQHGGYGRQGRHWSSPVGGLYTSFLLRPSVPLSDIPLLSLVMSVAVRRTVAEFVPDEALQSELLVKWPNDVLYNGGKITGISLEALADGVCVGVGLNAFHPLVRKMVPGKYQLSYLFDEQVATSEQGAPILSNDQRARMEHVLAALLVHVHAAYLRWCTKGFADFLDEFRQHMAFVDRLVTLETIDGTAFVQGHIEGVNADGNLLVRDAQGTIHQAASGEVHVASFDD